MSSSQCGELTIDLAAIRDNYHILQTMGGGSCETGCSIKADAYGLGMARVAPALYQSGARSFFVAMAEEGLELRRLLPDATIYVLHGFCPALAKEYESANLIPVLNSSEDIRNYREFSHQKNKKLPCALHFNTGMNRLGLIQDEAENIFLEGLDIVLVMSHFSSSDERDSAANLRQYEIFKKIAARFPATKKSLCNSSGIFHDASYHFDLLRPGLALYGGNPTPEATNPMCPVVSLSAPVLQIHAAKKGETAGYNETYRFTRDTNLAVVSAGYADGLFRSLSNKGQFYWQGRSLPVRGRISMDLVICDLEHVPESEYPKPYDRIEIIGKHQSVDDLAAQAGTISYEILTSLGTRYKRHYV